MGPSVLEPLREKEGNLSWVSSAEFIERALFNGAAVTSGKFENLAKYFGAKKMQKRRRRESFAVYQLL
jgi:hypothetical protein